MKIRFNKFNTGEVDISLLTNEEIKKLQSTHLTNDGKESNIVILETLDRSSTNDFVKGFPNTKVLKKINPFASIKKEFKIPEFKNFNVITGLNGSGKTHFLRAIESNALKVEIEQSVINQDEIAYFDYLSFILDNEDAVQFDVENLKRQVENHFESSIQETIRLNLFSANSKNNLTLQWRNDKNKTSEAIKVFNEYFKQISLVRKVSVQSNKPEEIRYSFQDIFGHREDIYLLTDKEINIAIMTLKNKNNFLTDGFSVLFRSAQNEVDTIIHQFDYSPTDAEQKYKDEFGFEVPWTFVNQILSSYQSNDFKFGYKFEKPIENLGQPLKANLIDYNNQTIEYQNLSSGEKVLLTLSLFIIQRSLSKKFPKVLLLDEIDSTLHPSLSKKLIETLKQNIVARGTKIILATHNASTVAFCDEKKDGIFIIENSQKIYAQSKNKAIDILSSGMVSLNQGTSILEIMNNPNKELFIISEGNNTTYLQKASEFFINENLRSRIEIIDGIEAISSDDKLKILFEFLQALNIHKKILVVWDSDSKNKVKNLQASNNVFPFIFEINEENKIAKRGIENLFPEGAFSEFMTKIEKPKGDTYKVFDDSSKKDFLKNIVTNCNKDTFTKFMPLFEKIESIISCDKN